MCSRYSLHNIEALKALLRELGTPAAADPVPRYNIPPTTLVPAVVQGSKGGCLESLAFGFRPARGGRSQLLVNARAETLLERPAFRDAAQHRRCLVPANGFYEWLRDGASRIPYYFHLPEQPAFFLGALWQPGTGEAPAEFVVVTTAANEIVAPIHDRMPVILGPNSGRAWLGSSPLRAGRLARLCRPLPAAMMAGHRVDSQVNSARFEGVSAIQPAISSFTNPTAPPKKLGSCPQPGS